MDVKNTLHPIQSMINSLASSLEKMGLERVNGNQIVTIEDNFDNLNIPDDHPARDEHDTFFLAKHKGYVLRTHTSSVQNGYIKNNIERLRKFGTLGMFSIGKVFRYEATDATHEVQFHQCEGLVMGKKISFGNLTGTLERLVRDTLGGDTEIRLRPGYFPFVEPGVEIDAGLGDKWYEILGAGMVHPQVVRNMGLDPEEYGGFAFGVGIERLVMIKYKVNDIRLLFAGDVRLQASFE